MNSFKLLTFLFVLGAGLLACKDGKTAETTSSTEVTADAVPTNSETSTVSILEANKQNALNNLTSFQTEINKEIDNFKAQLESVSAEAKAGIKEKIAALEQLQFKIQEASTKVSNADEASWGAISTELEGLGYQVKQVIKPGQQKLSAKQ